MSAIGIWVWPAGFLIWLLGMALGAWIGWGWGWEHGHEDAELQERLLAAMGPPQLVLDGIVPPEVAHEAWTAHVEQALAITGPRCDGAAPCEACEYPGPQTELIRVAPDPRTDTAWTRDMAKDMD